MKSPFLKGALCLSLAAGALTSVHAQLVDKTPLLHMSFDNVSGTNVINDGTGGATMNGAMYGGASIVPGGKFGNALQVLGVASPDASVRILNAVVPLTVQPTNAWTVACWIQSTVQGGTWMYQGSGGWGVDNTTFAMVVNNGSVGNNGHAAGGVRNSRGWQQGTATVDDGNWHHIVFTFDGTNKVQYVDGVVDPWIANQWNATPIATGNQFWIGGGGTGQNDGQVCLNGLIDEAYVFNRALSQSDVKALYDSNNVPVVPLTVAVSTNAGYRGQVFTYTATATPANTFSVTNARVDLSPLALSATASLVLSNNNVFTNTFTVPNNSPIGTFSLKATVIDNEPLVGSAGIAFTVIPKPPTNATALAQLTGPTNYYIGTEASYTFNATNDSPDHFFNMTYTWLKNGSPVSTNAMGPNYTFLTTAADNNSTIQCIAKIADTNFSSIAVTSGVITMVSQPGALVYTNGLKREFFPGATRANVELGNVPAGRPISSISKADSTGGQGDNYTERFSGYFIPPTNGLYVFFLAADDDTDLYFSTTSDPANKQLIAQETGYSGLDSWFTIGGNGSVSAQKRSDQFTNSAGIAPFSGGFSLTGGQQYYIESVHHQGTGGDNWGVAFQTVGSLQDGNNIFTDTTPSDMTSTNSDITQNNLAFVTWPGTNITFTQQIASKSAFEGDTAQFFAIAVSDAEMVPTYTWYVNGVQVQSSPNGTNFSMSAITLAQNGAQISVVASTPALKLTNGPVTLTVQRAVFESGYVKEEKFLGLTSRTPLENGTAPSPTFSVAMPGFEQGADSPGGQGDFAMRMTGFFIPPVSGDYVFFISSDDDSDLFLSTDETAAHKILIAQEAGWSGTFSWLTPGNGSASVGSQKRTDTFIPTGSTTIQYPTGQTMTAGQKYYMEVDHHNGAAGGTHVGVRYKIYTDGDPANGAAPNAVGNAVGINAIRSTVGFTQQPANASGAIGGYTIFSALGTTDSQLPVANSFTGNEQRFTNNYVLYQWYKNGVAISNATSSSLVLGPLEASDAGAQITCQIRSLGFADASFNPIWSNSLPATLTLTTAQQVFEPGYVQHDVWTNQTSRITLEGGAQNILPFITYATPRFSGPDTAANPANYIQRISGYFVPATDGNYNFFVNSDDESDLFLSTDSTRAHERIIAQETVWSNPLQWNTAGSGSSSQKSSSTWSPDGGATVPGNGGYPLIHGQKYYLELAHHNGSGNNNASVTYYNGGIEPPPLNGDNSKLTNSVIGMYVPRVAQMAFSLQPADQTANSGGNSVTFSARGNSTTPGMSIGATGDFRSYFTNPAPAVIYQWYKNGVAIPGANSSNYTLVPILPSDNGAQFSVGIRVLGYADNALNPTFSNSVPATLTVVTDTVPPLLTYAATLVNSNTDPIRFIVDVTFNEWMDTASANTAGNYTVAGASVMSATLAGNHRTVELVLNQMPTLPLNVVVSNVKDVSGNSIAAASTTPINPVGLIFQDIGNPGNSSTFGSTGVNPAYPSSIWVQGTNGFIVSAEGSDIFGTADGFNFGWELKTNDFDAVVRVVSNGHTHQNAKAGLDVREDLSAGSRNWSVVNDPASSDGIQAPDNSGFGANTVEFNARLTNSIGTLSLKTNAATVIPRYPNAWVRIKRVGNVLSAYASSNAVDWVLLGINDTSTNVNGALPSVVYLGVATTAHNNDSATANPPPPPFKYYNTAEYADYNSSFVATTRARVSASVSGTNVVISWTPAGGHLETSPAINGAGVNWQSLGTANPSTNPITSGSQFWRVVTP